MEEEVVKVVAPKRSVRRHHDYLAKRRARWRLSENWNKYDTDIDDAMVGKNAAQHGTCDCWMCTTKWEDKDISDLRKPQFIKEEAA